MRLALRHPDATVIGVDRSAVRLGRGKNAMGDLPENALCVRAELGGFWRLIAERGDFAVDEHFLYYPNPYPKKRDLGKRWHGHPTFPVLLGLGARRLVLRSNWRPYLEEFEEASRLAGAGFPPYEATLEQPSIERAADAMHGEGHAARCVGQRDEPLHVLGGCDEVDRSDAAHAREPR